MKSMKVRVVKKQHDDFRLSYGVEKQLSLLGITWWSREYEILECLHGDVDQDITFKTEGEAEHYIKRNFPEHVLVHSVTERVRYIECEEDF